MPEIDLFVGTRGTENVEWPESASETTVSSSPQCLDEHRYLITRFCDTFGNWDPVEPPACTYLQANLYGGCPEKLTVRLPETHICLHITEPKPPTGHRSKHYHTIFDIPDPEYEMLLQWLHFQDNGIDSLYWMPATLAEGILSWTITSRYSDPRVTEFQISGEIPIERISYVVATFFDPQNTEFYAEDAFAQHKELIVYYEHTISLRARMCRDGWFASLLLDEPMCFRMTIINQQTLKTSDNLQSFCEDGRIVVVDSPQRTRIIQELSEVIIENNEQHFCLFNFDKTNELPITSAVWEILTEHVNYVNWADSWRTNEISDGYLMLDSRSGKWSFRETFSCVVCEQETTSDPPYVALYFMEDVNVLTFVVRPVDLAWGMSFENPDISCMELSLNNIWQPFAVLIRETRDSPDINSREREFSIELTAWNSCSNYICSIYDLRTQSTQNSNIVRAYYTAYDSFAIIIKSDCNDCNDLTSKVLMDILTAKESTYSEVMSVSNVKLQLSYISDKSRNFLFHLNVSLNPCYSSSEENHLGMNDPDSLRVYYLRKILSGILPQIFSNEHFEFKSLNSTEMCLPPSLSRLSSTLNWMAVSVGETSKSIEQYICSDGFAPARKCIGDSVFGGMWDAFRNADCKPVSKRSEELFKILSSYNHPSQTRVTLSSLLDVLNTNSLHPFPLQNDVLTISKIMVRVNELRPIINQQEANLTFNIYNELLSVNEDILRKSADQNATNQLLHSLEIVVNGLELTSPNNNYKPKDFIARSITNNLQCQGVEIVHMKRLFVALIDPNVANVTGIGLFSKSAHIPDDFYLYNVSSILKFQSSISLLLNDDLAIATYITSELLDQLQDRHGLIRKIVIVIFNNDNMFQSDSTNTQPRADRMIVSISVPEIDTKNLPESLSTYFRSSAIDQITRNACNFWNYTKGWSMSGVRVNGIHKWNVQCNSTHLTHFGHLLLKPIPLSLTDERILNMITIMGCSVSLLGISAIFTTAVKFPLWRSKSSSKFLLQFSAAITMQLVLFVVSQFDVVPDTRKYSDVPVIGCIVLGVLHHYAVLLVFVWQLVIAYLQFMRYVVVLHTVGSDRWIRNVSVGSWSIVMLPPIVVLIVDPLLYVPDVRHENRMCYPQGDGLVFGLLLPIGVVIVANIIVFIVVLWNLMCKPKSNAVTIGGVSELTMVMMQLRLFVMLFFLLGLTWLFGFLASFPGVGIVFAYLFCMTATVQGLMLFVYFIGLDPMVRRMWFTYFQHDFCRNCRRK